MALSREDRVALARPVELGLGGRDSGIEVTQLAGLVFELDDEGRSVYFALHLDPERAFAAAREREADGQAD